MKKQVLAIMAITLIVGAFLYQNQEASSPAFEQWKAQYGVNWGAEQQLYRRMIFERNVAKIEAHNADPSQTYKMGVNQFTILTQQEFVSTYLTTLIPDTQPITEQDQSSFVVSQNIDWVDQGKVSPIKNQGQCGSCWAFSTTGVIESAYKMNGTSVRLSEQQLVDCSGEYGNQGCNGGWPQSALKYVIAKGIASQSEYPYTAKTESCKSTSGSFKVIRITTFTWCSGLSSGIQYRPISVTVDATNWKQYTSGVLNNCGTSINHAVLLVGVIDGNWKIKNSWGLSWGESGYIRLAQGNTCGVCQYPGVYGYI